MKSSKNRSPIFKIGAKTASRVLLILLLLLLSSQALAAIVNGHIVCVDNGKGIANVAVSDGFDVVITNKNGGYRIDTDEGAHFVFITTPEGYSCKEDFYEKLPESLKDGHKVDFQLLKNPRSRDREFTFISFTDTHLSKEAYVSHMINTIAAPINRLKPAPRFVVGTGDLTIKRGKEEFAASKAFTDALKVPFYGPPGNHDTYDDSMPWRTYEEAYGPPYYAWQYGPYTFVCFAWTWNGTLDRQLDWLEKILPAAARGRYVIFFSHSWDFFIRKGKLDRILSILNKYDVKSAFEGHWHMMRNYRVGGIQTFMSQTGRGNHRDLCHAGFRIVELSGDGTLKTSWHSGGREKHLAVISPQKENPSGNITVAVNAFDSGAKVKEVIVLFQKKGSPAETVTLSSGGGWTWKGLWQAKPGLYTMTAVVKDNLGREWRETETITVKKMKLPSPKPATDWPHFRNNPARTGVAGIVLAPPLSLSWMRTSGQMFGINSPVVSKGKLYVGLEDDLYLGTPDAGLLCLDAADGKQLWRRPLVDSSLRSTPSVADGIVAVQTDDGHTLLYDAENGKLKRRIPTIDYTMRMFNSSPLLHKGELYSGNGAFFARYPALTKDPAWSIKRSARRMKGFIQSSPTLSKDLVLLGWEGFLALNRKDGSIAWQYRNRKEIKTPQGTIKFREVCSTPVVSGEIVVWTTTRLAHVVASELKTGKILWSKKLGSWNGFSSPAVSNGTVFVVAETDMIALDLKTGNELWRTNLGSRAFSSPAVTGGYLYFGDEAGFLHCLNTKTGDVEWKVEIGTPIQGSPAISGNSLYITARDGTIYCFTAAEMKYALKSGK